MIKMEKVDVTIIGAGVIGLAVAAEVSQKFETVIVEQHAKAGQETSSRNSEVVHSGIYYAPESLKFQLCREGRELLEELCMERNISFRRTGKLIIATCEEELGDLETLYKEGKCKGIEALEMLSPNELKKLEPKVQAKAALRLSHVGIIDIHALMSNFEQTANMQGAFFQYRSEAICIERESDGYSITLKNPCEKFTFRSRVVVNSAGLHSDKIASLVGIDTARAGYKIHFCKGEYFFVKGAQGKLSHLIYPLPSSHLRGLGIHATPDLAGELRLGPNAFYVPTIDYEVDETHKQEFYQAGKRYLPFLREEDLYAGFAGIRPKLQGPKEPYKDFVITHETERGFPGFINLLGIESPGLTCSPAIAKHVSKIIENLV